MNEIINDGNKIDEIEDLREKRDDRGFRQQPKKSNIFKKQFHHGIVKYYNSDYLTDPSVSTVKHSLEDSFSKRYSPYAEIVFKCKRKKLFKNTQHYPLKEFEFVIVQVDNGIDVGTIYSCGEEAINKFHTVYKEEEPEFSIIRHMNFDDFQKHKKNLEDEIRALAQIKSIVKEFNLDMKVTETEWQFDRQRLTVYFTAPQRIDFRELVKELARVFKTRIELRQISSREEAKRIGGMGPCGRCLCCTSFVSEFTHVTLDHARIQQLANNVAKLTGYCGRLKCCLLFEHDIYVDAFKNYPPLNSIIELPEGNAKLVKVDIFKNQAYIQMLSTGLYCYLPYPDMLRLWENNKIHTPKEEDIKKNLKEEFGIDEIDLLEDELI
jgi:cell fate regulator YaaT (PSP1 superfamily)